MRPNSKPLSERFLELARQAKTAVPLVTPSMIREGQLKGTDFLIVDVREESEWNKGDRIPGAVHLSRGVVEQKIEELAPDLDTPIVCYCAHGNRGALAAESLARMGYKNVSSLDGGLKAWTENGFPKEKV